MQLNGLELIGDVHGLLKGKDYRVGDVMFPIIGTYIEAATTSQNGANMTDVHSIYSGMMSKVVSWNSG